MKYKKYIAIAAWVIAIFILVNLILFFLNALSINFVLGFLIGIFAVISINLIIDNKITLMEWFYIEDKKSQRLAEFGIVRDGVIRAFENEFAFLSNSYQTPFRIDGVSYSNVDQYFHAMKTSDKKQRDKILSTDNPNTIFKLGRECQLRKDWETIRLKHMKRALIAKFNQNKDLRNKLIATKGFVLENGTLDKDLYWGKNVSSGSGENHLGKILMELRDKLVSD